MRVRPERTGIGWVGIAALAALLAVATALMGTGCGGGGGTSTERAAGMTLRIRWPESSRAIPQNTASVRVEVRDAQGFQTSRVANRPAAGNFSTLVFFGLRPGPIDFDARAYAASDAQGVPVARASSRVSVAAGIQTDLTLALNSTVEKVEVTPAKLTLKPGETGTLVGAARDAEGNLVPLATGAGQWRSGDTAVATVDGDGKVTAVAVGSAQIFFTDTGSGKLQSALVVVSVTVPTPTPSPTPTPIDRIEVTPSSAVVTIGRTLQLTATPRSAAGDALPLGPGAWSSDNIEIVAVDAQGRAVGVGRGAATLAFTDTASGKRGTARIRTTPVDRVRIDPQNPTLPKTRTLQLAASAFDSENRTLPAPTGSWTSSLPEIATVDDAGLVTAVADGETVLTFTDADSGKTATTTVRVQTGSAGVTIE